MRPTEMLKQKFRILEIPCCPFYFIDEPTLSYSAVSHCLLFIRFREWYVWNYLSTDLKLPLKATQSIDQTVIIHNASRN